MANVAETMTTRGDSGALMKGSPPFGPESQVTLANWQDAPANKWGFQHARELVPTARIRRGSGPTWILEREERDVRGVTFEANDLRQTVGQMLEATHTDGFLVIHRGKIAAEYYFNGMQEDTPHLLMSVSKSITAALAGRLVERGALAVDAPITELVPELAGTAFTGATARHLLDMRAGVRFNENYDDVGADVRVCEQVYQLRPRTDDRLPADAISYFATLQRDGEHGGGFRYSSILTDVLAWVLERAGGARFHELVSTEIWAPIGAEFDAEVTVDAHGNAMADGGISTTMRDLGRFGLQYLTRDSSGRPQVVPREWVRDTIRGASDGAEVFSASGEQVGFPPGAHYRNCWWVRDGAEGYLHGSGIYGQNVFVHGPSETVVVKFSSWAKALDRFALESTAAAVVAIGRFLDQ
jgi:CubicO group peptidase (beta-lactamase class C family)